MVDSNTTGWQCFVSGFHLYWVDVRIHDLKKNDITVQSMRSLHGVSCDINPFGLIIILTDLKDCLSFVG